LTQFVAGILVLDHLRLSDGILFEPLGTTLELGIAGIIVVTVTGFRRRSPFVIVVITIFVIIISVVIILVRLYKYYQGENNIICEK